MIIGHQSIIDRVECLRRFLTHDEIVCASRLLEKHRKTLSSLQRWVQLERQPVLHLFEQYDKLTFRGTRTPHRWPNELMPLALFGSMVQVVCRYMPESVRVAHRKNFLNLSGQHWPITHEWESAYNFATRSWPVNWYETSSASPEFAVNTPVGKLDVECTWIGNDIAEKLKASEAQELVDAVLAAMTRTNTCGHLSIRAHAVNLEPPHRWQNCLETEIRQNTSAHFKWSLPSQLDIDGHLTKRAGTPVTNRDFVDAAASKPPFARKLLTAWERQGHPVDLVTVTLHGPRMTPTELRDYVWDRLSKKAGPPKFDGSTAGLLAIEFHGVSDAKAFSQSHGLHSVCEYLLVKFPHLVGVVFRGRREYIDCGGHVETWSEAYSIQNDTTRFPDFLPLPLVNGKESQGK